MSLLRSRRAWLGLAAGCTLALGAGFELESLRGHFDNRRIPRIDPGPWRAALRALEDPSFGAGAFVHVGHSTHLLSLGGKRFLTDPWFYDPAFGALAHSVGPAVAPSDLGPIDAVLLTHDHPDHADRHVLAELDRNVALVVGQPSFATALESLGHRVVLLDAWQTQAFGPVTVTAVPALHDIEEVGFVLEYDARVIYFAGDTALSDAMNEIARRFRVDLAILPVDGTRQKGHPRLVMNPEEALSAAGLLKAKWVVPSHAEATFPDHVARELFIDAIDHPAEKFQALLAAELEGVECWRPLPASPIVIPRT